MSRAVVHALSQTVTITNTCVLLSKLVSVGDLMDEVCPDENYTQLKKLISVETQTLECGLAALTTASKSLFDYYTLQYDDSND